MPMINVFAPKGALTRAQVELLTEKLTHELLVIEGVDNDASMQPELLAADIIAFFAGLG